MRPNPKLTRRLKSGEGGLSRAKVGAPSCGGEQNEQREGEGKEELRIEAHDWVRRGGTESEGRVTQHRS